MKCRTFLVIQHAVEMGAAYGVRRAYKHTDEPTEEQIIAEVESAVMNEICEWFMFENVLEE